MKRIYYFILVILPILLSCDVGIEKKSAAAPELIEFLKINKNEKTKVYLPDLFFANTYKVKFRPASKLKSSYNSASKELTLKPGHNFSGLEFLHFSNNGKPMVLPVIVKDKVTVTVQFSPKKATNSVYVMGSFNTWNRKSLKMTDTDNDGTYTRELQLDPGIYEYQFVTDYGEFPDPQNPEKVDNGYGSFNSILEVTSDQQLPNIYALPSKKEYQLRYYVDSEKKPKVHVLLNNQLLKRKFYTLKNNAITIDTKQLSTDLRISVFRLIATSDNQPGNVVTTWTKGGKVLKDDEFIWQDAVIYSLMIDRFENGNTANDQPVNHPQLADQANFQGGDFQGIMNKIQAMYFEKIGVNTIWISPVNQTTNKAFQEWPEPHRYYSGYHGYWPTAARETEPRFGKLEELQKLVTQAHDHDLKILLDYVSNHTHIEHPYYQKNPDWFGSAALQNGKKNIRRFDEYRLTTWFDTFLPSFDFINSDTAVDRITDDAIWWLEQTNVDGFRHDATKHIPLTVWRTLTRKLKQEVEPEKTLPCYQIGETFGSAELIKSYVNNGMLDSQFNFELFFSQRRVFADPDGDFRDLLAALHKSLEIYGYNHVMGNILDSHDQVRMMALLEGDVDLSESGHEKAWLENKITVDHRETYNKQQALLTFVIGVPGTPIIYYGDEFGMTGAHDPDNRRMMRFGNELNELEKRQLDQNARIIKLRKKYRALRRGDYLPLYCDKDVMIFSRGCQEERLIIAINKSDEPQQINLDFPGWLPVKKFRNVLTGGAAITQNSINLPAYSGSVWECQF